MKLHYSQTLGVAVAVVLMFYYPMKLHYSQTDSSYTSQPLEFYYPMKLHYSQTQTETLLPPQSFTTLWNYTTLKHRYGAKDTNISFTTLWNYTTLKPSLGYSVSAEVLLPYEITLLSNCSCCLSNFLFVLLPYEITLLSNYTYFFCRLHKFYYPMKLHYSQT